MMRPDHHFLDDIAKVAGGAVNVLSGLRQQIENDVKARVEEMATRMDLVPREDLERVQAQLTKLQTEHKDILARLAALEGGKKPAGKPAKKKAAPLARPAPAPKTAKKARAAAPIKKAGTQNTKSAKSPKTAKRK